MRYFSPSPTVRAGRVPLYLRRQFMQGLGDDLVDSNPLTTVDPSIADSGGGAYIDPSTIFPTNFVGPLPSGAVVDPGTQAVTPVYDPATASWYDASTGADIYVDASGALTTVPTNTPFVAPSPAAATSAMTAAAKAAPGAAGSISSVFSAIAKALTPGGALRPPGTVAQTLTPAVLAGYLPWIAIGVLGIALVSRKR